jgi:hypothetical protein
VLLIRTKATAESKEGKQCTVLLSQTKAAAEFKVSRTRAAAESEAGKQGQSLILFEYVD